MIEIIIEESTEYVGIKQAVKQVSNYRVGHVSAAE
jgi:hypothetical protein